VRASPGEIVQITSAWVTQSLGDGLMWFAQEFIHVAGCQWLTPIILATQEAEIRRIEV
jgi:hypothetical protein